MKFSTGDNGQDKDDDLQMLDIPELIDADSESDSETDSGTSLPIERFSNGPLHDKATILQFQLNPNNNTGMMYESARSAIHPQEVRLYEFSLPGIEDSPQYHNYLAQLYKNFEFLGDASKYRVPSIGLVSQSNTQETRNLNNALNYITEELSRLIDQSDDDRLYELLNILKCLNAVYFITNENDRCQQLFEWINMADGEPDLEFARDIMESAVPFQHGDFWALIVKLVTRGLFNEAKNALEQSNYTTGDSESQLDLVLADMAAIFGSYNEMVLKDQFGEWKQQARELKDNLTHGEFFSESTGENLTIKKVYQILSIITGSRETLLNSCDSWYEAFAALSSFGIRETGQDSELMAKILKLATTAHPPPVSSSGSGAWERTCIDVIEGNFLKVLRSIEVLDKPTVAYVSRLFEAKGFLDQYKEHSNTHTSNLDDISGYFLTDHALTCLESGNQALVAMGVGILSHLGTSLSRSTIANYLCGFDIQTNDDLEWALSVAAKLELTSVAETLYRVAAQKSLRAGRVLESLTMFSRGKDVSSVKHNCWLVFEKALLDGCPINDASINDVVTHTIEAPPVIRQCIAPYAVLVEFYNQRSNDSSRQAVLKLFNLLKFPHLPKKYSPVLVANLLPFITLESLARLLTLHELIMIILIIDNYETEKTLDAEDAEALYTIAVAGGGGDDNDWRVRLSSYGAEIPQTVAELVTTLRKRIAAQVSSTFLEEV